jgi:hypothetical protein
VKRFWKWLDWFKPVFIEDEYFGRLRLVKGKIATRNYWKGTCWFRPLGRAIDVTIRTIGLAGPTPGQRAFFQRLEADYDSLRGRCQFELVEELCEWKNNYQLGCLDNAFTLRGLEVPLEFNDKTTWEVHFEIDPKLDDHLFTVLMRGWRAETVAVEGA